MYTENLSVDISWVTAIDLKGCMDTPSKMVHVMKHDLHTAMDLAGNMFFYDGGKYRHHGDEAVEEMYIKTLRAMDSLNEWSDRFSRQLVKMFRNTCPNIMLRPHLYQLNLANGVYDWDQDIFGPSEPEYRTTVQLPIKYDPSATCPTWDRFLEDVLPQGVKFLKEVMALCLVPHMGMQKCIVLVGSGVMENHYI